MRNLFSYLLLRLFQAFHETWHEKRGSGLSDTLQVVIPNSRESEPCSSSAPCGEMSNVLWYRDLAARMSILFHCLVQSSHGETGICLPKRYQFVNMEDKIMEDD